MRPAGILSHSSMLRRLVKPAGVFFWREAMDIDAFKTASELGWF